MVYVLLPAYNEEKGVGKVLDRLPQVMAQADAPFRIVVVDDGSRDRTAEVVSGFQSRLDLKLIRFEKNRGVGEVFKAGLRFIVENSASPEQDVCVVLDSDNTQDPLLMLKMISRVREGSDIVIASRFAGDGGMVGCPLFRRMLSAGASWLLRLLIGLPGVKDYSTFYRAYRVSLLQAGFARYGDALLAGQGFAAIAGLLIRLARLSGRISEVPFLLRYDLKEGRSGIKLGKTILGYLALACSYRFSGGRSAKA